MLLHVKVYLCVGMVGIHIHWFQVTVTVLVGRRLDIQEVVR